MACFIALRRSSILAQYAQPGPRDPAPTNLFVKQRERYDGGGQTNEAHAMVSGVDDVLVERLHATVGHLDPTLRRQKRKHELVTCGDAG